MTIRDKTRGRRTYSFFRSPPIPVTALTSEASLKFDNLSELGARSTTDLDDGELIYVQTVRDYFVLEKTVTSGSTNDTDRIAGTGGGVWYRLSLTEPYWRNQATWYINADVGADENLGSIDAPIKSHDEFVRRLLATGKIRNNYVVNLTSLTASIAATYAVDIELDGGSVTYVGHPGFTSVPIGTVSSSQGAVNYALQDIPHLEAPALTGTENFLYASQSLGFSHVGIVASGTSGQAYTTAFTSSFVGNELYEASLPSITTAVVSARGAGTVEFRNVNLEVETLNADPGCTMRFITSEIHSSGVYLSGGRIELDRCRLRAVSGSISVQNKAEVAAEDSVLQTFEQNIYVDDMSRVEFGATTVWGSSIKVHSGRLIAAITGASGSALVSGSTLTVMSDSVIDMRNIITSGTVTQPLTVLGQHVNIFYDEAQPPKTDPFIINNGTVQTLSWSQAPWNDMLRDTRVVSGSLENS